MNRQADLSRARNKLDNLEALSNKDLLERAWKEISALCGSDGKPKQWTMSIPVDADRDSDVLFGEVLMRFRKLEAVVEAATEFRNAELRSARHQTTCKNGCNFEGDECDGYGDLWLNEMKKRKLFWDALDALEDDDAAK